MTTASLLTQEEAAERIRVCAKTLRRFRQQGMIPYVAVGARKIFYRAEDCDAFLSGCVKVDAGPTRRKVTRPRLQDTNVVGFTARRRARLEAQGR